MKTTGLSRVSKDLIISEVQKEIKKSPTLFITQHGTVAANLLDKLRAKLLKESSRYLVIKNTLGRRVLSEGKLKSLGKISSVLAELLLAPTMQ